MFSALGVREHLYGENGKGFPCQVSQFSVSHMKKTQSAEDDFLKHTGKIIRVHLSWQSMRRIPL